MTKVDEVQLRHRKVHYTRSSSLPTAVPIEQRLPRVIISDFSHSSSNNDINAEPDLTAGPDAVFVTLEDIQAHRKKSIRRRLALKLALDRRRDSLKR